MKESKQNSTSNLALHLAKHDITKNSTLAVVGESESSNASKPKVSPKQSIINWVVNTLSPFAVVEHLDF